MKKFVFATIISFIVNISLAGDALVSEPSMGEEVGGSILREFSSRIAYGSAPGIDDVEIFGETIESAQDDSGARLELSYVARHCESNQTGVMVGGGFFYARHNGFFNGVNEAEVSALGLIMQIGLAARAGDWLVLELGPYLGLGWGSSKVTYSAPENSYNDTGRYVFYGIKGGAFIVLGTNAEVGIELGQERFTYEGELGVFKDISVSGTGGRVAVVLTIKF